MNNAIELFELIGLRRKVCRLHATDIKRAVTITEAIMVMDSDLYYLIVPAFHEGNTEDENEFYIYVAYDSFFVSQCIRADKQHDHATLGVLFGYPNCCIDSFCKNVTTITPEDDDDDIQYWMPAFEKSNTFQMFSTAADKCCGTYQKVMNPHLNILAHFPCSLHCKDSINIAKWRAPFKHIVDIKQHTETHFNNAFNFCLD